MVTKQELSGKWNSIAGAVQEKYGQITDNDLKQVKGDLNQLAGLIQRKTGQAREQVEAFLDECCVSSGSVLDQAAEFASSTGQVVREGYDEAAEQARRGYETTVRTMSRHPLESTGVALGLGLIVGLAIGVSIGANRERELSWFDRMRR